MEVQCGFQIYQRMIVEIMKHSVNKPSVKFTGKIGANYIANT